jgi:hypothetical protein
VINAITRCVGTEQSSQFTDLLVDGQRLILPILGLVFALSALLIGIAQRSAKGSNQQGGFALIVAFSLLGGVAGLITGNSREPIAGPLLTGLLGVITALLAYLFSSEALRTYRPYIPFLMMALMLNSLVGLSVGAGYRKQFEVADREYKEYLLNYERVYLELKKEEGKLKLHREYSDVAAQVRDSKEKK